MDKVYVIHYSNENNSDLKVGKSIKSKLVNHISTSYNSNFVFTRCSGILD